MTRRRLCTLLLGGLVAGCSPAGEPAGERAGRSREAFTSAGAADYMVELDGRLELDAASAHDARTLVIAQLMYAVGQLNGERANARFEGLELGPLTAEPPGDAGRLVIAYHAPLHATGNRA